MVCRYFHIFGDQGKDFATYFGDDLQTSRYNCCDDVTFSIIWGRGLGRGLGRGHYFSCRSAFSGPDISAHLHLYPHVIMSKLTLGKGAGD